MRRSASTLLIGLVLASGAALASSHREAPQITETPKVDSTDFYMFRSYEPGRADFVTLIASYYPFQDPYGGPNYFSLDADARYRIHLDNTGDGIEDLTFEFRVVQALRDLKVPVGGQEVSVPLYNLGPIAGAPGARSGNLNVLESYTMRVVRGPLEAPSASDYARAAGAATSRFGKPADNVGGKSIGDYDSYAAGFVWDFAVPRCAGAMGRVFVGQRRESFAVNVGDIFDLVNLNPLGDRDAEPNTIGDKNVTTFALEVPIRCLTRDAESPVVGGWQTAALPRSRSFRDNPGFDAPGFRAPEATSAELVQVSRLGMPLVNEVVIGLKDKNLFNSVGPRADSALATYVTNPTLPEILELLFPVSAPNHFPRTDLVAAFATGIEGLNFLSDGQPHEMQRLNTSIAPTARAAQDNLGVLGGDNAGFPNGRRPGDDVVDIELRVAMGVLCHAFPGVFCDPADAPSGTLPYTDQVLQDASQFTDEFPYLQPPLAGSPDDGYPGDVPF